MASVLPWWPAGSSDFNSNPIWQLLCQEREELGWKQDAEPWYNPVILSSPGLHTDLHHGNCFSQQLLNLTTPLRAMGSPKYFSIPQGKRMQSSLLKKGTLHPTLKTAAALKYRRLKLLTSDSFIHRDPISFLDYFSQQKFLSEKNHSTSLLSTVYSFPISSSVSWINLIWYK